MKKTLLVLIVLTGLTKITNAQKGSTLLYGNFGFTSSTNFYGESLNSYTVNPGIGFQLNDNWTAGLNISVGGTSQEEGTGNTNIPSGNYDKTSFFNIGPFLRRSYSISNIFSIYGQLEVNYLSGTISPYLLNSGSYNGFGAGFFPALGINIKNGFAFNLSFGGISYQTKSYKGDYYTSAGVTNSANQFAVTFGSGASFGISKNFGPKAKK